VERKREDDIQSSVSALRMRLERLGDSAFMFTNSDGLPDFSVSEGFNAGELLRIPDNESRW